MATSREHVAAVRDYYYIADQAYRNWGPDPDADGIFAIHMGYHQDPKEAADNHFVVKQMTRQVVEIAGILPGQSVLDAGCGVGSVGFEVARRYPECRVYGINVVDNQIRHAELIRRKMGVSNIFFCVQDYLAQGFSENQFDRVIYCESLAHAEDKYRLMEETYRTTKRGGKIVIADCFLRGDELSQKENEYLENFSTGMSVPGVEPLSAFVKFLSDTGYSNVDVRDVTKNVLPSVKVASNHAERRLKEQLTVPQRVNESRLALMGLDSLLTNGKLGYFFLVAEAQK